MAYNGWMLPDTERARVLERFVPRYEAVKASHVTLSLDDKVIPRDANVEIVGYATDDKGVEALVCTVDGEYRRPDGLVYHLTLSVAEGRASKESNDVIGRFGWCEFDEPMSLKTRAFLSYEGAYLTTPLSSL
jgi:hypothetical protein